MLDMTQRMIPNGEGFEEPGSGANSALGGTGSDEDEDGRPMGSPKMLKTAKLYVETNFPCQHIQGLTESINEREESSDDQDIAKIETKDKPLDLLKNSQEQLNNADKRAVDENNFLVKLTKDQFETIREKYLSTFVPTAVVGAT